MPYNWIMANMDISVNETVMLPPDLIQIPVDPPRSKSNPIIDIEQAAKLYSVNGLSYDQIAKQMGCTRQAVHQRLQRFKDLLIPDDELKYWQSNRVRLKDTAELSLFLDMMDPEKRKAASLNNTAYAYKQIHETRRLDDGLSTSNIDLHAEYQALKSLRDTKFILQNAMAQPTLCNDIE